MPDGVSIECVAMDKPLEGGDRQGSPAEGSPREG
jgi:hypothetical protein